MPQVWPFKKKKRKKERHHHRLKVITQGNKIIKYGDQIGQAETDLHAGKRINRTNRKKSLRGSLDNTNPPLEGKFQMRLANRKFTGKERLNEKGA